MSFSGVPGMYNRFPPGMVLLVAPVLLALLALTFGPAGRYLASHAPLTLLLGFQVFRTGVELSLHHLYVLGLAPKLITLEGGNIEILVAITAPLAAWASTAGRSGMRIAYVWNVIGILSLGNVVVRAVLTAPGPLHFIDGGVLDFAIITSPFTAIPGFMAPLALALHILAFRAFSHLGDKASGRP
jgi:hypothetical protein